MNEMASRRGSERSRNDSGTDQLWQSDDRTDCARTPPGLTAPQKQKYLVCKQGYTQNPSAPVARCYARSGDLAMGFSRGYAGSLPADNGPYRP